MNVVLELNAVLMPTVDARKSLNVSYLGQKNTSTLCCAAAPTALKFVWVSEQLFLLLDIWTNETFFNEVFHKPIQQPKKSKQQERL